MIVNMDCKVPDFDEVALSLLLNFGVEVAECLLPVIGGRMRIDEHGEGLYEIKDEEHTSMKLAIL